MRAIEAAFSGWTFASTRCSPHVPKDVPQHEPHALLHVALTRVRLLGVVAEVGAVEHPADDLAQDEDAKNCLVVGPAYEQAFDVGLAAAGHPPGERFRVGWWPHPASMQCATAPVRRNNLRAVAVRGLAEVAAFTQLEDFFAIRFSHAVPTIPGRLTLRHRRAS